MSTAEEKLSIEDYTPELNFLNRLDNHFIYVLHFIKDPLQKLSQKNIAHANEWIEKLTAIDENQTIKEKLRRNNYLTKLLECVYKGQFEAPFIQRPPLGGLAVLEDNLNFQIPSEDSNQWVNQLKKNESKNIKIGGKDFETFFSSKILENGAGACAYVAVSTRNDSDKSAWMKIKSNNISTTKINDIFMKEFNQ